MNKNERIDDLQNGYFIIQDKTKFCFGVDAVLISDFVDLKKNKDEKILDLGTGNGIIPLLLYSRKKNKITGIEISKENTFLAKRNMFFNNISNDICIINGDIKNVKEIFKGKKFDIVVSNPPYMNSGGGILNEDLDIAAARHEVFCNFENIVEAASYVLNHGGSFYFIHRPNRLTEIIVTLKKYNLEPKKIKFVHSYIDTEATMVLVSCKKYGKEMCKILSPKIIYER
ncbi:MAG: methyltransferase [Defluviitaleaceae bacterium]|nr:methyltransferase [Defluviitaleaceae bacterium]